MSQTRYIRRRSQIRRRAVSNFGAAPRQAAPFFSFGSENSFFAPAGPGAAVHRKCENCEQEEKKQQYLAQAERLAASHAPQERQEVEHPEEEKLQRQAAGKEEEETVQRSVEATAATASASHYISSLAGKGQSLSAPASQFFSARMAHDFSHVKVHTDQEAAASAKQLNARAYTVGNHVVFNDGQYQPELGEGKKLLAHELAHVVQQDQKGKSIQKMGEVEQPEQPFVLTGQATNTEQKQAYGCAGVQVQGHANANYSDTFSVAGKSRPATTCEDCEAPACVTNSGTLVSVFRANPTIHLPPVPSGLTPCETEAVRTFINTTLRQHELQHVAAFNTYNATIRTPYTFSGCQDGLDAYIQSLHNNLNAQRLASANALSDALDPFNPPIPCDCE